MKTFVGLLVEDMVKDSDGKPAQGISKANVERAFDYLQSKGKVHEVGQADLISAVVNRAFEIERESGELPLILTPFNRDRQEFNAAVREQLKAEGRLGVEEFNLPALESKGWTRAMIKQAQYYQKGDVVRFNKSYPSLGIEKGEYLSVASVDTRSGTVSLKRDSGETQWQPAKNNQVEVYDSVSRQVSVGDSLRVRRNSESLKNGEVITISEISAQGAKATTARGLPVSIDLSLHPHWDHAYATTVHAAQGRTTQSTILAVPSKLPKTPHPETEHIRATVFGIRSAYVSSTRARESFEIFANNGISVRFAFSKLQDKAASISAIADSRLPLEAPIRRNETSIGHENTR